MLKSRAIFDISVRNPELNQALYFVFHFKGEIRRMLRSDEGFIIFAISGEANIHNPSIHCCQGRFNDAQFMIKTILIAGTGGFIGTVLRFLVSRYFQENTFSVFPWGTFTVNIVGSLLIGIFYGISERGNFLSPDVRIFLTVGICGGFTTFSSLSNDAFMLLQDKEWLKVSLYTSLSFFLGLVAVYLGRTLIKGV